jgi:hypothetical protein
MIAATGRVAFTAGLMADAGLLVVLARDSAAVSHTSSWTSPGRDSFSGGAL